MVEGWRRGPPLQTLGVGENLEGGGVKVLKCFYLDIPIPLLRVLLPPYQGPDVGLAGHPTFSQILPFLQLSLPAARDESHCKNCQGVFAFFTLILCFKLLST